jgi:hypothetical protein
MIDSGAVRRRRALQIERRLLEMLKGDSWHRREKVKPVMPGAECGLADDSASR